MKYLIRYLFICCFAVSTHAQESISEVLKNYNTQSIPYITVDELSVLNSTPVFLDARELKEFEVSHIKGAIYVGHDDFNIEKTTKQLTNKQQTIVVYCTLGVRSETIAEQLKNEGYTNIYNLFGGILEWKNNNQCLVNSKNNVTDNVHTYSKKWSQWLLNGNKIYE